MAAVADISSGVFTVASELQRLATLRWRRYIPWVAFWFCLHVLFERIVPAVFGAAVYDVFNNHRTLAGKKPLPRPVIAKDVRTRLVAIIFAVWCVAFCVYGVFIADDYTLLSQQGFSAWTPLTLHMNDVACGFFVWDSWVSIVDGFGPAYVFHGLACSAVFFAALGPSMHSMCFMALGFEASTIPLHARRLMIMAGRTDGPAFAAVQMAFAGVFFICRVALAWPPSYAWALRAMEELRAPSSSTPKPVVVMFMILCGGLSLLNAYWMAEIVGVALRSRSSKAAAVRSEPLTANIKKVD